MAGTTTSKSLRYSQEIDSTQQHEERPGRSLFTQDPEVVRQWAEERGAVPATVPSNRGSEPRVLRFKFRGGRSGGRLQEISWDDWLRVFEERGLSFIYQEHRSDGRQSNFFRLESPDREDA